MPQGHRAPRPLCAGARRARRAPAEGRRARTRSAHRSWHSRGGLTARRLALARTQVRRSSMHMPWQSFLAEIQERGEYAGPEAAERAARIVLDLLGTHLVGQV